MAGLAEQAKGATEVAAAMDDSRKQAAMTARAVTEQARAVKQIDAAAKEASRLASAVTKAMGEQTEASSSLAAAADRTRRVAKQTARRVEEQSDTVASIVNVSTKATTGAGVVTQSTANQAMALDHIAQTADAMRAQVREAAMAIAQQGKRAAGVAQLVEEIAEKAAYLTRGSKEQIDSIAKAGAALGGVPPGGATSP
jgi:methyl-accepting chemotaxis protein